MPLLTITAPATDFFPLNLFRLELIRQKDKQNESGEDSREQALKKKPLICSHCSATITSREEAVSVNGQHEHAFFNPAGIAFEVRCFMKADGCLIRGEPTTEFSWFDGRCWQYASCSNCLAHLGWLFSSSYESDTTSSFFGLIADKLI